MGLALNNVCDSIAQWLEHWSRKPGVVSSILTGGSLLIAIGGTD